MKSLEIFKPPASIVLLASEHHSLRLEPKAVVRRVPSSLT